MVTKKNIHLYLDDVRIPNDDRWEVVVNYDEFVKHLNLHDLSDYEVISFDHDLGTSAMAEYFRNVRPNGIIDYDNISEKTGLDCAKFLVQKAINEKTPLPKLYCHSANPVGTANIVNYLNSYLQNCESEERCRIAKIEHGFRPLSDEEKAERSKVYRIKDIRIK